MTPMVCLLAGVATASDPISINIAPALDGYAPSQGTMPVAVELRNDGPDARGVLKVTGNQYDMEYPIELPRGSQKRLLTYPTLDYGNVRYTLLLDRGRYFKSFEPPPSTPSGVQTILLVSDSPGEMAFLRSTRPEGATTEPFTSQLQDAYVKPLDAPDRPVGYANLCAVVLGAGSERLSDEQVQALKTFAMTGGTLVFVGGASSPILADGRWQDTLPATGFHTVTLRHSDKLEDLGGSAAPPFTDMTGVAIAGASSNKDDDVLLTASRPFGIGKILYLAYNPFEPPLSKWDGRALAFSKEIHPVDFIQAQNVLQEYSTAGNMGGSFAYGAGGTAAFVPAAAASMPGSAYVTTPSARPKIGAGRGPTRVEEDPFSTSLPAPDRVFELLGAYFIVVIPLNFLILKKLRRGELAWITAPLIALGFSGAFFMSAQDLYSAKMSSAAQGVIVGQVGMPFGMFVGSTQMFIPNSGSYDLQMHGVDSLGVVQNGPGYYGRNQDSNDLNPQDTGEVTIPDMQANNLAFRQISYRQRVPVNDWFSIDFQRTGPHAGRCYVRNTGDYTLQNAYIALNGQQIQIGTVLPGESKTISIDTRAKPAPVGYQWEVTQTMVRLHGVALFGYVKGYRPGPQLGTQVDSRTSVRVILVAKEGVGE